MAASSPEMRAAYAQENLRALAFLGEDAEQRVRAAAAEPIAKIVAASRMAWLPVELNLAVLDAIALVSGEDLLRRHAAEAFLATARTPLLRPLAEAAIRLLGLKPESIFKWVPQAWSTTFKGCGRVAWTHLGPGRGRVILDDCPQLLAESRAWRVSAHGAFEGGLALTKAVEPRVTLETLPSGGRYELFWRA